MDGYVAPSAIDPAWNPKPPRRWGKWIVIGIIAALFLFAGVWWFVFRTPANPSAMQQAKDAAEQAAEDCASAADPAVCRQLVVSDQAASIEEVGVCGILDGEERDQCVLRTAYASGDVSLCAEITNETIRASCTAPFESVATVDCQTRGAEATSCLAQQRVLAALASGDPASCDSPDATATQMCRETLEETDQDDDDLTFTQEATYGSSDKTADTDGDGYQDGAEVAAGFNPAGPGAL